MGQHGAHLGPFGARWAPCRPHELCYRGQFSFGLERFGGFLTGNDDRCEMKCHIIIWDNRHSLRQMINVFNSLRPRQNRHHIADDVFKYNFLNENVWIPIKMSLKFVPKDPFDLAPNRRQTIIWTNEDPVQRHIYASLGLNELSELVYRVISNDCMMKISESGPSIVRVQGRYNSDVTWAT